MARWACATSLHSLPVAGHGYSSLNTMALLRSLLKRFYSNNKSSETILDYGRLATTKPNKTPSKILYFHASKRSTCSDKVKGRENEALTMTMTLTLTSFNALLLLVSHLTPHPTPFSLLTQLRVKKNILILDLPASVCLNQLAPTPCQSFPLSSRTYPIFYGLV
jgi:hypothetical protein